MKKQLLRLLPVAAVLLTASCTDDQYDISNVDTESRFTVKDLVVPLNMSPIKLVNIISIEENSDIKIDKDSTYYFQKSGDFNSEAVNVKEITINKPKPITQDVIVDIKLSQGIQDEWKKDKYKNMKIKDIRDQGLMSTIGLTEEMELFSLKVSENKDFKMKAENIDEKVTMLKSLGIDDAVLNINIKLEGLQAIVNSVSVENLTMDLPCGMTISEITDRESNRYSLETGVLNYGDLEINGEKNIILRVTGLDYIAMKGNSSEELFNPNTHVFNYEKKCGVSGTATVKIANLKDEATYQDIENAVKAYYSCEIGFNKNIVIKKFSGGIKHKIKDIEVDPVEIKNLPKILQDKGTNIVITNPQLYLDVHNPYFKNNIKTTALLQIEGNEPLNKQTLDINKEYNKFAFSPIDPQKESLFKMDYKDYWKEFLDLGKLLGDKKKETGIPEELNIKVEIPELIINNVENFKLGENENQSITGNWEFYAKLSLDGTTNIKYTNDWDDWGSKDLNGLTVENATVNFKMTKDVALDADITFTLNGEAIENGKMVEKKLVGKTSLNMNEQEVPITMTGGPIKNIKGGNLVVILKGKGKEIRAKHKIEVSNLRMKVDGYYDKEF